MLLTLLAFALALGVLITFHELGHYWMARACGVRVLRFSVGFGRVLLRRRDRHGTEWAVSAIPLGGYVKMQDVPPDKATAEERAAAFTHKSLWQRGLIVLAGPLANLVLAALLYGGLYLLGSQEPAAILAAPPAASAAAHAGLQGGDTITAVNGQGIDSWNQLRWKIMALAPDAREFTLTARDALGQARDHVLSRNDDTVGASADGDGLMAAGLVLTPARPRVTQVLPGGAGERAGLLAGDVIMAIAGHTDPDPETVIHAVQAAPNATLAATILRQDTTINVRLQPQAESLPDGGRQGRIGVLLGAERPMALVRYGIAESLGRGTQRMAETAWLSLRMLGRMLIGQASWQNISGPVTIADYAGQTARAGIVPYIGYLALISVSIGVLNLLPIPMLDGGHLLFLLMEAVRRRPVPERWLENGQRLGLVVLAGLMGLAFFNDFLRLFS